MNEIAENLILQWSKEIESIGIGRKIESINFFPIEGDNTNQECFKVNFNFGFEVAASDIWEEQLLSKFFGKLYEFSYNKPDRTFLNNGPNGGETTFNNSKADYMTYQGHRFIIQFYPAGFISEMREEKLIKLGING